MGFQAGMRLRRRVFLALPALGLAQGEDAPVFIGGCNFSREQLQPSGGKQSDLEKFGAAGVRVIVAAVGSGSYFLTGDKQFELAGDDEWILGEQRKNVNDAVAAIRACPRARLITNKADMRQTPEPGTLGVILHISGNNHTFRVETVDEFARLGVRAWHPALPYHNRWCSAKEGLAGPVLTDFGREAIARMNERGIVLDTAHATDESARAFIKASKRP
ncbi:MAG: membrane dipeptidase, partial [Bryobacteraceae bacterium]